jgi:hypothetical protein
MSDDLIERAARAAVEAEEDAPSWIDLSEGVRDAYRALARAVLSEAAAAQSPAPKLCGCADAERTYEQLLDYTAELGGELDRQRALIAAVLARCDEAEARAPHIVGGRLPAILPVAEIRALLEGEKR